MTLSRPAYYHAAMSWLGIDVGTTGCKAAAYDGSGRRIDSAYHEYRTLHPRPGWSELDSVGVWRLVREAIADVAARTLDDPIRALCVS